MSYKQRLELDWVGKDKEHFLEPRILIEDESISYGTKSNNLLIKGDNLLALKALEKDFSEQVKCIYIDPPFNTGQAFEHYDDGIEHSLWLSLMRDRLIILRKLMREDGTIFIHIDDNELAYLTVLCDEIFGRENRAPVVTFKQASATGHKAINRGVVSTCNYILTYSKNKSAWNPKKLFTARERNTRYNNFVLNRDKDMSEWKIVTLASAFAGVHDVPVKQAKKLIKDYDKKLDEFVMDNAEAVIQLAYPDYNSVGNETKKFIDESKANKDKFYVQRREGYSDIYLVNGQRLLFYSDRLKLIDGKYVAGEPLTNLWDDILSNNLHKEGGVKFPKGKKPEALIKRCIEMTTEEGDIVLDSFLGSGTTAAVAHKLKRRWIGIEMGDHCHTHVIKRLNDVIDGTDTSGITKVVSWEGGGGYSFYNLAPSLLQKDERGNWIINTNYNSIQLAEAVCKHEKFKFFPDKEVYWKQGFSSEKDFIFITTQFLTSEHLDRIASQMKAGETLLICAKAFRVKKDKYPNISLKKIPQMLLGRCEFGKDDYSLNVKEDIQEEANVDMDI